MTHHRNPIKKRIVSLDMDESSTNTISLIQSRILNDQYYIVYNVNNCIESFQFNNLQDSEVAFHNLVSIGRHHLEDLRCHE